MDIWIWLLVALLVFVPKKAASDAAFDRVRSLALLLGLLYLIVQA